MLNHVNGHIMTKNEHEDAPVLVFNPVNTSGVQTGVIGDYITTNMEHVNGLYRAKCSLIRNGHTRPDVTQNICLLADMNYLLLNAFCLYNNADIAVDEGNLVEALRHVKFFHPTYTVRIPYKLGHKEMTRREWQPIFSIIMRELVDKGVDVEIWHRDA